MQQRMSHAERTDLSDRKMLQAAVQLILSKGAEKTTLKDVGELAGYSRGLAGYRFGSKDGLFKFVLRSLGEHWLQELAAVCENKVGLDAIIAATQAHYRMCELNPDDVRAFYILWFDAIGFDSEEVRQAIIKINLRRHHDLVEWITQDSSLQHKHDQAQTIASHFSTSLNGIVYQWLMNPENLDDIKALHESLINTMRLLLD
ncbi:MAG: TetR/AcrR family transcriptional regulator [Arenicella sp.]